MEKVIMSKKEKVEEVSTEEVSSNETVSETFTDGAEAPIQTLTLVELDQIAQIIDLASQRGAFRGGELQAVGSLFNKLTDFLGNVKAQQEAALAEQEGASAEAETGEAQDGE